MVSGEPKNSFANNPTTNIRKEQNLHPVRPTNMTNDVGKYFIRKSFLSGMQNVT